MSSTISSGVGAETAPAQGSLSSAGAGITGGYTGNSLALKTIIAFFLGLAMYNSLELIVLIFVTFNKYRGLYFWSLIIAGSGVIVYSLGFLMKFFQLLDPETNAGYVAVVFLTIGWYPMVTGQSIVLWSRLHLLLSNQKILRYTLYMIIINAIILHIPTTVLTIGSNSNTLSVSTANHFVHGYNIMEKIQMFGFCTQEFILSYFYVHEAIRLLGLSRSVSVADGVNEKDKVHTRKTMYQLLAINVIIVAMDIALLAVEFANLYIIETTLKGAVYSIKLKLEFAVLGKLVQLVTDNYQNGNGTARGGRSTLNIVNTLDKPNSNETHGTYHTAHYPDFVDPERVRGDVTHADEEALGLVISRNSRRRTRKGTWIEEEMDKHNIGPFDEFDDDP